MSNYGVESAAPTRHKVRKTWKEHLRDYLSRKIIEEDTVVSYRLDSPTRDSVGQYKFNNSFEGWTIRLHKAHDGHIVEAWKYEEQRYTAGPKSMTTGQDQQHILFTVRSSEDMATALNDILVQLALRS